MNKLSTENLNILPNPIQLQRICKSISALEAIICQEWQFRYYSYQKDWSETEECCEMRNGQGDQMLIVFSDDGICINGFAHESKMNGWKSIPIEEKKSFIDKLFGTKKENKSKLVQQLWTGIVDELPEVFNRFMFGEPVKSIGTTFCIWRIKSDTQWRTGEIDMPNDEYKDGSSNLLQLLDGKTSTFKNWAEEYYDGNFEGKELKLELVEKLYNEVIITTEIVKQINPELEDFEQLKSDLNEIGYKHNL
jgi:5'-3' exonuclease